MANTEHLKILKEGLAAWNKWRFETRGLAPDLNEAELPFANLGNANLSGTGLNGANLTGANLRNADLSHSQMIGADLTRANLTGAILMDADLIGAHLGSADLCSADLSGTDLGGADLGAADLTGADLSYAHLRKANLANATFSKALLGQTAFAFTSLKTAKGLDACRHDGPSALDYQTLMESGPLPEVFLRGCGLSDEFIRYLPSFRNSAIKFYSCFISYSHADKSFARRLHDALQGRGIRCWLDEHQILPGDKIHRAVDEGIRLWDKVLLCCSKDSLTSWWVDKEVEKALMKEEKLSKERGKEILALIPLNLNGYMFKPDWQDWKQQHLTSRMAPDFTGWDKDNAKFEKQLEAVIKALRAGPGARELPPNPRL